MDMFPCYWNTDDNNKLMLSPRYQRRNLLLRLSESQLIKVFIERKQKAEAGSCLSAFGTERVAARQTTI